MAEGNPHIKVGSKWHAKNPTTRQAFGEATVVAVGNFNLIYNRENREYSSPTTNFLTTYEPVPVKHYLWKERGDGDLIVSTIREWPKTSYADYNYKYMGEVIDYQG